MDLAGYCDCCSLPGIAPLRPSAGAQQEPILVGRIAHLEGEILRYVPETKDWVIVRKDAPFGLEDALYSDVSAKAEFVFPNRLLVRIGPSTQIQLIVLKGDASELDVASGVARFYNRNSDGMLKVTTPFGYVLAEPGRYRSLRRRSVSRSPRPERAG